MERFSHSHLRHFLRFSLAAIGDLEGLEIWSLAGADLSKPGYDGQTVIQVVCFWGETLIKAVKQKKKVVN